MLDTLDYSDYTDDQLCAIIEALDVLDSRMWQLMHMKLGYDDVTYKALRAEVTTFYEGCLHNLGNGNKED